MNDDDPAKRQAKKTPLQRALDRAQREARIFDREQQQFRQADDDQEPFRLLMFRAGRIDSPYRGE